METSSYIIHRHFFSDLRPEAHVVQEKCRHGATPGCLKSSLCFWPPAWQIAGHAFVGSLVIHGSTEE
jgi:hypothetical protein